ncbi:MAG: SRPBCC family protein [Novosphingobium sp.]|nr:SRPBCC family protein [Novosphingobium sp.]
MRRLVLAIAMLVAAPAQANVFQKDENGFVVRHAAELPVEPDEVWSVLIKPSQWWNGEHSYSGDAANLSLDARAGGCFCEIIPNTDSPRASPRGSVEHMRVIYAEKDRVLRMSGGLGPLQSEAVNGVLTIVLKPGKNGTTQILWEYVIGGYMRLKSDTMAPAVDSVLGDQLARLAKKVGGTTSVELTDPVDEPEIRALPEIREPADIMGQVIEGR